MPDMKFVEFVARSYNFGLGIVPNICKILTPQQLSYYESHPGEILEALARGFAIPSKFELLVDLGIIKVPMDYNSKTQFKSFLGKNPPSEGWDDFPSGEFVNTSRPLIPCEKIRVRAWKVVRGPATSDECMDFLAAQNSILVGAQGASLVYEQKRKRLLKDVWYGSFDKKNYLWKDPDDGRLMVPGLYADPDGEVNWSLEAFEDNRTSGSAILSFYEV